MDLLVQTHDHKALYFYFLFFNESATLLKLALKVSIFLLRLFGNKLNFFLVQYENDKPLLRQVYVRKGR